MYTQKRTAFFFFLGGISCFILAAFMVWHFTGKFENSGPTTVAGPVPEFRKELTSGNEAKEDTSDRIPSKWVIYITGSVKVPGIYEIDPGSRIYQVIEKAGGLSSEADPVAINLALPLSDGMHVHVPSRDTESRSTSLVDSRSGVITEKIHISGTGNIKDRIDINRADMNQLQSLPGIGPKTAGSIITYRKEKGFFRSVEELLKIKGIGPKKLEAIKDCVTCSPR